MAVGQFTNGVRRRVLASCFRLVPPPSSAMSQRTHHLVEKLLTLFLLSFIVHTEIRPLSHTIHIVPSADQIASSTTSPIQIANAMRPSVTASLLLSLATCSTATLTVRFNKTQVLLFLILLLLSRGAVLRNRQCHNMLNLLKGNI